MNIIKYIQDAWIAIWKCTRWIWGTSCATITSKETKHTAADSPAESRTFRCLLDQLPKELLDEITTQLDPVSFVCLHSTSRHFRTVISIDRATLNKCMEWQIMLRFRKDMVRRPPVMACSLCKTRPKTRLYDASQLLILIDKPNSQTSQEDPCMKQYYKFTKDGRASPSAWWSVEDEKALYYKALSSISQLKQRLAWLWKGPAKDMEPMHQINLYPGSKPKCYVHFMEGFGTNDLRESLIPYMRMSSQPRWLVFRMLRCMHCGRCVAEGDKRTEGCLRCLCDWCPREADLQTCRAGHAHTASPTTPVIKGIFEDHNDFLVVSEVGTMDVVPMAPPTGTAIRYLDPQTIYYANNSRAVGAQDVDEITQQKLMGRASAARRNNAHGFYATRWVSNSTVADPVS